MAGKKLHLDKYYTSQELADYCTQKAIEVIGRENITELIESSAGNGVFLNSFEKLLPEIPYQAYDIEPEDDRIVKQDYLSLEMEYKKGRVVIGNPPFGDRGNLCLKFYKKSILLSEYIVFILPIKQYKNTFNMYEYDLLHSENLKLQNYSGIELHCCLNIFKKPKNKNNNRNNYKLKDVEIISSDHRQKINFKDVKSDVHLIGWGDAGKVIDNDDYSYCDTYKLVVKNNKLKGKVIELMNKEAIKNEYVFISSPRLNKWQVYKYLKENIEGIE